MTLRYQTKKNNTCVFLILFTEHPSEEESEWTARECEFFLKNYPKWFPKMAITRKAFVLGMILPIFIRREKANNFNFLSAEERGESLHKLLNEFERQYCSISYKPLRYFFYETSLHE